ncbi:GNAT family N-acetyltransferase [Candidatus Bathyarchaeota archaeon]|nr:GNAT family N-acetyltransferase [Candidatus Bathyarchaeota archaeon]
MNHESVVVMRAFHHFLKIMTASRFEHLTFNLLNFNFFKNSEGGNLLFSGGPQLLFSLTVIPYILTMEVILFRGKRYFVKLNEQIVGTFVIKEKPQALYINSLSVDPKYRRLGIATHILDYIDKLANQLGKKWLELSVLKVNLAAIQLYKKLGFVKKEEKKWAFTLKKRIDLNVISQSYKNISNSN